MTSFAVAFYALCMLAVVTAMVCGALFVCERLVRIGGHLLGWAAARRRRDPPGPDPERRIGDRERAGALAVLRDAYADGRLDLPELESRAAAALAARTAGELEIPVRDLAQPARRLRSHELAAGLVLLLFSSTAIRILGLCLVFSALRTARPRPVPIAFAAGLLVPVSLPAALVLGAALAWDARSGYSCRSLNASLSPESR